MLSGRDLGLWRGATCLFRDLSFSVSPGEALIVQGPNGSGKTTLLRVIAGLTMPEEGRVLWGDGPLESARRRELLLAYCGHLTGLKPDLTVVENLGFFGRLYGCSPDRFAGVLDRLRLTELADLELRFLSAGQKRRAALARVLMCPAPLWLLDEPQANLDAAGQSLVADMVGEHLGRGGLAVIATHQTLMAGTVPARDLWLGERAL